MFKRIFITFKTGLNKQYHHHLNKQSWKRVITFLAIQETTLNLFLDLQPILKARV